MAKGFPLMSNPTKAAYTQTAGQTIAQVVADLGNMMTILYTADLNTRAYKKELRHWRTRIPMNTKVLRLIEEGRRSASEVAPLLRSAVKNCIALYDEAAEAWDQTLVAMWKAGGPPPMKKVTGDNDPYYAQHRRYEAPTLEFYRIHYVAYAALYCLANIGELDAETLGAWMNLDKHPRLNCPDLNVWLIDCYFQQGRATNAAAAARHYQLTQGQSLSGQRIVQSKWNAGWDIHEPLLAARDVDTRDIQRIEVLDIPSHLPISDQTKEQIVANFVESVSQKR